MKQIIQSLSSGNVELIDIPIPKVDKGQILIKTSCSLISSGTERMLIEFGKSNLFEKASNNPERVRDLINKIAIDGPLVAIDAVNKKLEEPITLGYSNVGKIVAIGENVTGYQVGERVVSNGPHSEYVLVDQNLCAKIPDEVLDEDAVFVVLASIGLQGIRLSKPSLGETFVVCGLGLIGLLTAQLLKANGCNVLGIDPDQQKINLANSLGLNTFNSSKISECISWCKQSTNNVGVDGFLITAATKSNSPIDIASQVCRKRGRIVLIGTSGLEINRSFFYDKELTFKVSCSYGPGRYDPVYEKKGIDYPIGFVRWTEKRNFEAVLEILKSKKMDVKSLITNKFEISRAKNAYKLLSENFSVIAILFTYKNNNLDEKRSIKLIENKNDKKNSISISVIGAGGYAKRTLIPYLSKNDVNLQSIFSKNGLNSTIIAKKYKFKESGTNPQDIWTDENVNTVFILTRHNSHAEFIIKALNAGKNVYVEKPLCLTEKELELIINAYKYSRKNDGTGPLLMVGFNRRFSKFTKAVKKELQKINSPKAFTYTINAGFIDKDHWTNDVDIGGGRIIGEGCHFLDLIIYLVESKIDSLEIVKSKDEKICHDTFSINVKFQNGSIGNINYFSNGNWKFPKERLEIFSAGKIYQIHNFLKLRTWGTSSIHNIRSLNQDKGQQECIKEFLKAVRNAKEAPIPFEQICEVQKWLLMANKKT